MINSLVKLGHTTLFIFLSQCISWTECSSLIAGGMAQIMDCARPREQMNLKWVGVLERNNATQSTPCGQCSGKGQLIFNIIKIYLIKSWFPYLENIVKIIKNKCKFHPVANAHHHVMIFMYSIQPWYIASGSEIISSRRKM